MLFACTLFSCICTFARLHILIAFLIDFHDFVLFLEMDSNVYACKLMPAAFSLLHCCLSLDWMFLQVFTGFTCILDFLLTSFIQNRRAYSGGFSLNISKRSLLVLRFSHICGVPRYTWFVSIIDQNFTWNRIRTFCLLQIDSLRINLFTSWIFKIRKSKAYRFLKK